MKHDRGLVLIAISAQKFRQLVEDARLRRRDVRYLAPMLKAPSNVKELVQVVAVEEACDPWANAEV